MTRQQIIKKWLPVTQTLSNDIDMCKEMALYCEHHDTTTITTLPAALKIMSKLKNLKGKKIVYTDKPVNKYCCRIMYSLEQLQELNVDIVSETEHLLIEEMSKKIDKDILGCTEVHIHKLVSTIFTTTEMNNVYINFISDVIAKGNRKDKLRRILQ